MIENSKKWAAQRGLVEKSEIHGEEEWRIPVHRSFEQEVVDQSESKQKVAFRTEDIMIDEVQVFDSRTYDRSILRVIAFWRGP